MNARRWFSPLASAAALTLLGSLTAMAVEGGDTEPAAEIRQVVEEAPAEEDVDLVFEIEVDTSGDDVDGDEGRPDDAPDNHGQTVSDFARSTELMGCEKGHAISAVARGADPSDPQSSPFYRPCHEGGDDLEGSDSQVEDAGEDSAGGPPHGYAGPPPGKGPSGDGPAAAVRGKGRSGR